MDDEQGPLTGTGGGEEANRAASRAPHGVVQTSSDPPPQVRGPKIPKIRVSLSRKRPKGRDGMLLQCVAIPEEVHREAAIYVVAKGQHGEEPSEFSGLVEKGLRTEMELRPVSEEWKKEALTAIQEADSARAERRKAKEGA